MYISYFFKLPEVDKNNVIRNRSKKQDENGFSVNLKNANRTWHLCRIDIHDNKSCQLEITRTFVKLERL